MGDMKSSYGLSASEVANLKELAARRAANRQVFLKRCSDPHRTDTYVFDAGIQRHNAMSLYQNEFFRPTPKTFSMAMLWFVLPTVAYGYIVWKDRKTKEHMYRTGQVTYKDRLFKFI